jgi:hypothetical protein
MLKLTPMIVENNFKRLCYKCLQRVKQSLRRKKMIIYNITMRKEILSYHEIEGCLYKLESKWVCLYMHAKIGLDDQYVYRH